MDPQLQELINSYQLSPEDKKSQMIQGLLSAAGGFFGNMYKPTGIGLAGGLQGGLLGYQQAGQQQQLQRMYGMHAAQTAMQLRSQQQQFEDQAALRKADIGFASQFGIPGAPPQSQQPPAQMPPQQLSGPPDTSAPPAMPPAMPQVPQPQGAVPNKRAQAEKYQQMGDYWMQNSQGNPAILAKAQQYYDLAQKTMPQIKEQTTVTDPATGKRVRANVYTDGTVEKLSDIGPDKEKVHFADTGSAVQPLDPFTGLPAGSAVAKTQSPDSRASNALGYANLAESKRYHNLEMGMDASGQPGNVEGVANAIANYQQPPLSSFAMAKPYGGSIMAKVMDINPSYDAKNYGTAQQTANAFAKGSQGNTVRSINVAMQHLDTLGQAADALNNGNMQLFNKVSNFVSSQTGAPAPTNFNAVKDLVANEITKAIVGSGGGVSDRDKAQQTIGAANSPAQLKTVMDSYRTLFTGQLGGLRTQYEAGTQRKDFDKMLSPETLNLIQSKGGVSKQKVVDFTDLPR